MHGPGHIPGSWAFAAAMMRSSSRSVRMTVGRSPRSPKVPGSVPSGRLRLRSSHCMAFWMLSLLRSTRSRTSAAVYQPLSVNSLHAENGLSRWLTLSICVTTSE